MATVMAGTAIGAEAQPTWVSSSPSTLSLNQPLFIQKQLPSPLQNSFRAPADGPLYKVKVVFEGATEETNVGFSAYNENLFIEVTNDFGDFEAPGTYTFELPAGTYDFMARSFEVPESPAGYNFVVKEGVEVGADCQIVFSAKDASQSIYFDYVTPRGEEQILPVVTFDDFGPNFDYTEATVDFIGYFYIVVKENVGMVALGFSLTDAKQKGEPDVAASPQILTSPLSDKYHIILSEYTRNKDWFASITKECRGTKERVITNRPEDFVSHKVKFLPAQNMNQETGFAIENGFVYNNKSIGFFGAGTIFEASDTDIFLDCENITIGAEELLTTITPSTENMQIVGLPMLLKNGMIEYVNQNHNFCGNGMFAQLPGGVSSDAYPGHQSYSRKADPGEITFGDTAPVASIMTMILDYGNGPGLAYLAPAYIGQKGEVRNADYAVCGQKVVIDGETVFEAHNDESPILGWLYERYSNQKPGSKFEVTFTNDNFEIDGQKGLNETRIYYTEGAEDMCVPTVQMLQCTGTDGNLSNRFNKAEDGVLEFSAADFNFVIGENPGTYWFEDTPAEVKVEYSPYGESDFKELEAIEIPELYMTPNFGNFYRCSLAGIDRKSVNGWFDLKFTLTDAAGNKMEQIVSPVFNIANLSGIDNVRTDPEITVSGNNIICSDTARIFTVSGQQTAATGLLPGVYLVVNNGTCAKVVIR